jgi:hypothetical protein
MPISQRRRKILNEAKSILRDACDTMLENRRRRKIPNEAKTSLWTPLDTTLQLDAERRDAATRYRVPNKVQTSFVSPHDTAPDALHCKSQLSKFIFRTSTQCKITEPNFTSCKLTCPNLT